MITSSTSPKFTVSFHESFYNRLLKSRDELARTFGMRQHIAIFSGTEGEGWRREWKEIEKVARTILKQAEKWGTEKSAQFHKDQFQSVWGFQPFTFAANINTLCDYVFPQASFPRAREKMGELRLAICRLARPLNRDECVKLIPADFTFVVGEGEEKKEIAVHRSVLGLYPYFDALLNRLQPDQSSQEFKDVNPLFFEQLVNFLYTKQVPFSSLPDVSQTIGDIEADLAFQSHMIYHLITLADRFGIAELEIYCRSYLAHLTTAQRQWNISKKDDLKLDRKTFDELMRPYCRQGGDSDIGIWGKTRPKFVPLGSDRPVPGGFEKITLTNPTTGQQVSFLGNRVLLAARDLSFREWLTAPDTISSPLPPASVLQALAYLTLNYKIRRDLVDILGDSPYRINGWKSISQRTFIHFLRCILTESENVEGDLEQLIHFLGPEFTRLVEADWVGEYLDFSRGDEHTKTRIECLLSQYRKYVRVCRLTADDVSLLPLLAQHCPHLQVLYLEESESPLDLDLILDQFKELQELKLYECHVKVQNPPVLRTEMPSALKSLNFLNCKFTKEAFTLLSRSATQVSSLFYGALEIDDEEAFIEFLQSMEQLEEFAIHYLPESTKRKIAESQIRFPHLKRMPQDDMYAGEGFPLSNEVVLQLFSRTRYPQLEELALGDGTATEGESLTEETLFRLLAEHPEIKRLDLGASVVATDDVLARIGDSYKGLEELSIRGNDDCTEAGIGLLATKLPLLRKVIIIGDEATWDPVRKNLKAKYPHIKWKHA